MDTNVFWLLPGSIVLGISGGLLGALFIHINFNVNDYRKKYLTQKWMKPLETCFMCILTTTLFYWVPAIRSCKPFLTRDSQPVDEVLFKKVWCTEEKTYSPLASLLWNTEGAVIRTLMNEAENLTTSTLIVFFILWYVMMCVTYGTNVPSGLFLPGMIIGCTLGYIAFNIAQISYDRLSNVDPMHPDEYLERNQRVILKKYIILGCGGFMAGYTRMTYSLGVILMETTQDLSIFIPIIFTIIIANQVGNLFTRSLYQRATRGKQMPII